MHVPYCVCYYDGHKEYSFYVTDYSDSKVMMRAAVESLLKSKYYNYNIYVHNLSYFDGIFLFNTFAEIINENIKINPILKDGKMICINVKYYKYNISFVDSCLLLPQSLDKLSKTMAKDQPKYYFPHNFLNDKINSNVDLNYKKTNLNNTLF